MNRNDVMKMLVESEERFWRSMARECMREQSACFRFLGPWVTHG